MIGKVNNKGLFFVSLLLVFHAGFSQKTKLLNGRVVSYTNDVSGVTVQNISLQRATITREDGSFSILISPSDTLVFSAVQLKRKTLVISEAIYNSKFVNVQMKEFVNKLDEVVVKPYALSGDLGGDLVTLQLEKDVSAEKLGLPNADVRIVLQSENKLHDADNGKFFYFTMLGVALNVNKTLNRLSGRTKMLKNRVKLDKEYETIREMKNRYLDSVLVSHLKISNDRFYDFFYYCQMDDRFNAIQQTADELVLWEFLMQKSKAYRKENKLD